MSEPGGTSSGGEAGTYAHCGLVTSPRGRCRPSWMLQVALSQEGHAAIQVRYSPQGVPGSRSRDGAGQGVLLHPQQSHPE